MAGRYAVEDERSTISPLRIGLGVIAGIAFVATCIAIPKMTETIEGDELTVIQSPIKGELAWYTQPGMVWQGFGQVTPYKKNTTYRFDDKDKGIDIKFNDGGHGTIYGSIQFELPTDQEKLTAIYYKYRDQSTLDSSVFQTVVRNAVFLSGSLMNSRESYNEKRNDLVHYITDQIQNGVYRTQLKSEWVKDDLTQQSKQITYAEIIMDRDNKPLRQETSVLNQFGIKAFNLSLRLDYDKVVNDQIAAQQKIAQDVQTSVAQAKMEEQRAVTVEQKGKADAAQKKWEQEALKAQAVVLAAQEKEVAETAAARDKAVQELAAQRDKNVQELAAQRDKNVVETQAAARFKVAELDKKAAEETKNQQILLGEGESERKRLNLAADGALEVRGRIYNQAVKDYSAAIAAAKFPTTIMYGGGAGQAGGALDSPITQGIEMFNLKTLKDLNLDMNMSPAKKQ